MTPSRPLTLAQLEAKGACTDQRAKFQTLFGASVEVTEDLCVEHADAGVWAWLAENMLSPKARDAYDAAVKPARDAYLAAVKHARDAYDTTEKPASDAYYAAMKTAHDAYEATCAVAWARAYISDGEAV